MSDTTFPRPTPALRSPTRFKLTGVELTRKLGLQDAYARWRRSLIANNGAETTVTRLPANLDFTDLQDQDFRSRDLLNARFCGADLRGADFTGSNIEGVTFAGADLTGAVGITVEMALSIRCSGYRATVSAALYDALLPSCDDPYFRRAEPTLQAAWALLAARL